MVSACMVFLLRACMALSSSVFHPGAGIYVRRSIITASGKSDGPQPSNSYAIVGRRFYMDLCSNTSTPRANFTLPNGQVRSIGYFGTFSIHIIRECYEYYGYAHGNDGVYTCNILDSRGNNISLNIGLYSEGFNSKWVNADILPL